MRVRKSLVDPESNDFCSILSFLWSPSFKKKGAPGQFMREFNTLLLMHTLKERNPWLLHAHNTCRIANSSSWSSFLREFSFILSTVLVYCERVKEGRRERMNICFTFRNQGQAMRETDRWMRRERMNRGRIKKPAKPISFPCLSKRERRLISNSPVLSNE